MKKCIAVILMLVCLTAEVFAGTVTLSWNKSVVLSRIGTPNLIVGYRIYYDIIPIDENIDGLKLESRPNLIVIDVGLANQDLADPQRVFYIKEFAPGTYYFRVSAYNSIGIESCLSKEVIKIVADD